jgi:hypothetical protein
VGGKNVKRLFCFVLVCFAVALAVTVGYRMSSEAMAVVIGVVFGVLASVPMSVLILIITQKQRNQATAEEEKWAPQRNSPPVVVIQGGNPLSRSEWPSWNAQGALGAQAPSTANIGIMPNMGRQFRVIGQEWANENTWRQEHEDRFAVVR